MPDGLLLRLATWPLDLWAMPAEHEGVEGRRQEEVRIVGPHEKGWLGGGVLLPKSTTVKISHIGKTLTLSIIFSVHGKFTGSTKLKPICG